jgi:hypothetical protein
VCERGCYTKIDITGYTFCGTIFFLLFFFFFSFFFPHFFVCENMMLWDDFFLIKNSYTYMVNVDKAIGGTNTCPCQSSSKHRILCPKFPVVLITAPLFRVCLSLSPPLSPLSLFSLLLSLPHFLSPLLFPWYLPKFHIPISTLHTMYEKININELGEF